MKYKILLFSIVFTILSMTNTYSQDTVDAIKYSINLDLGNRNPNAFSGYTDIYMRTTKAGMNSFSLDLQVANVDSVLINGTKLETFDYNRRYLSLDIPSSISMGDTFCVRVYYNGTESAESYGFGGIHFDNHIIYNLGAAIKAVPHNYGRAWYPCFDNFTDKAAYEFHITVRPGWTAYCNGTLQSTTTNADSSTTFHWKECKPMPTYLVSVAAGNFTTLNYTLQGAEHSYPTTLAFFDQDTNTVKQAFALLEQAFPMYEECFGPYDWRRIGYVATPVGSMEHCSNIALTQQCFSDMSESYQSVIIHELAHSWFGNTITCASEHDMWFNEGGASFCEEVGFEAALGKEYSDTYYKNLLSYILRTLHYTDGGYLPIYGLPSDKTYSTTVYDKGALVYHSLRGYMGKELFYSSIRQLMQRNKFTSMDSYAIRDSLSAYSGMDLTDFFDFHVFGPGFLSYSIDSLITNGNNATAFVRQRLVGTTTYANSNRVPITFFSSSMDTATRIATFDGKSGSATFELPFAPAFAIVDYYNEISDAVCSEAVEIKNTQRHNMAYAYAGLQATSYNSKAWINIDHHWIMPDTAFAHHQAIKRMSPNRYWKVTGNLPQDNTIKGRFWYAVHSNNEYQYLDKGFLDRSNSVDSLILLYRPNSNSEWTPISATREGNKQGYIVTGNIQQGEYALAIGYKDLMGIEGPNAQNTQPAIFPNPIKDHFTISLPNNMNSATIIATDINGREVYRKTGVADGETLNCRLHSGIYFFYLEVGNEHIFIDKIVVK